jgi:hypothetical protein
VAVAGGLFQANEHLLGLEAGGVIRRLGPNSGLLKVGQRVVVCRKGSLANRVQSPIEAIHPLPDTMSYEVSPVNNLIEYPLTCSGCFHHLHCIRNFLLWTLRQWKTEKRRG